MNDDRTKADKAWEARQEAAATASSTLRLTQRKRPTKQMMRTILQSWTKRATLQKLLPLRSPGTRLTPTC
jgi:hypothetical protein